MKFGMFTDVDNDGRRIAVNVDAVAIVRENKNDVSLLASDETVLANVAESYDVVLARLNTIAE